MKNDTILVGQTIRLKARIRNIDGDLVTPQSIEFELKKPNETDYTVYNVTNGISTLGTGIYYIDVDVTIPGKYQYSWFTYGDPQTSIKNFFVAEDARYL